MSGGNLCEAETTTEPALATSPLSEGAEKRREQALALQCNRTIEYKNGQACKPVRTVY